MLQGEFIKRLISIMFVSASFLLFASSIHAGIGWQTGYIDKPNKFAASSLKIAADGTDYIAFGGDNLMLGKKSPGGQWVIEAIDTISSAAVGRNPSLALDSNGYPHISYFDSTNGNLKYASFNGTTWAVEIVDVKNPTGSDVGEFSSLALDSNNKPCISYWGDSKIKYASFNGSNWDIVDIFDTGIEDAHNSLALDSANRPYISYYESGSMDLRLSFYTGSTWVHQLVDAGGAVGQYNSLALDSTGKPHISYYDETNYDLKYASWSGTAWNVSTLVSINAVGSYSSLVLDSNDKYRISYYNLTNKNRWVLTQGSLIILQVTAAVGQYTSLALDSDDNMRISYYNPTTAELKLATRTTGWTHETVAVAGHPEITSRALALDPTGTPGVAYNDRQTGDLQYASYNGSSWDIQTVESSISTKFYSPALAFDSNGNPVICYNDSSKGDLKLATWSGSSWSIITVDAAGIVGSGSSIALDSNNYPHISYFEFIDQTHSKLKYAAWTGSSWNIETVTLPADLQRTSSLALTSTNEPIIAFAVDSSKMPLHIVSKSQGTWSDDIVDNLDRGTSVVSARPSLAIDSKNNIHLSYTKLNNELRYAYYNGSAWSLQTIDSDGQTSSLAINSKDTPLITYLKITPSIGNWQLKLATLAGSSWNLKAVVAKAGSPSIAIDNDDKIWIAYETALPKNDLKFAVGVEKFPWPMVLPAIISNAP